MSKTRESYNRLEVELDGNTVTLAEKGRPHFLTEMIALGVLVIGCIALLVFGALKQRWEATWMLVGLAVVIAVAYIWQTRSVDYRELIVDKERGCFFLRRYRLRGVIETEYPLTLIVARMVVRRSQGGVWMRPNMPGGKRVGMAIFAWN